MDVREKILVHRLIVQIDLITARNNSEYLSKAVENDENYTPAFETKNKPFGKRMRISKLPEMMNFHMNSTF